MFLALNLVVIQLKLGKSRILFKVLLNSGIWLTFTLLLHHRLLCLRVSLGLQKRIEHIDFSVPKEKRFYYNGVRLLLQPVLVSDSMLLEQLFANEQVMKYYEMERALTSAEIQSKLERFWQRGFHKSARLWFKILSKGQLQPLGFVGIAKVKSFFIRTKDTLPIIHPQEYNHLQLAIIMFPDACNHRVATEALIVLLRCLHKEGAMNDKKLFLEASFNPHHEASKRLAISLGMTCMAKGTNPWDKQRHLYGRFFESGDPSRNFMFLQF